MVNNYARPLPKDANNEPLQGFPAAIPAIVQGYRENALASSAIALSDNTTAIEIAAVGGAAAMKWITVGDTQASVISSLASGNNYDHIIAKDTVRRFVVPIEVQPSKQSVVGANIANGLYRRVAIKTMAPASILASEY